MLILLEEGKDQGMGRNRGGGKAINKTGGGQLGQDDSSVHKVFARHMRT